MIQILDKSQCCGCSACEQICPQHCICLISDEQGFLYPSIKEEYCINCKLCEKACPVINKNKARKPVSVYAAINTDEEIRLKSSSGGIFTAFAENIIEQGGVVFGARFDDNWDVIHDYTDSVEGLEALRGSKYVQSFIRDSFIKVEHFLKQNRKVLFSGTPCQIAGLLGYLRKDYDNLITVEVACHGVPSPMVWHNYIKDKKISVVNFRDKSTGWKDYSVRIGRKRKRHTYDSYMNCFLGNYSLRQSCFNCGFKSGKSQADITIADLWGISKIKSNLDDNKGASSIIIWKAGKLSLDKLSLELCEVSFSEVAKYNPALVNSSLKPSKYTEFWSLFLINSKKAINSKRPSFAIRIKTKIYHIFFS